MKTLHRRSPSVNTLPEDPFLARLNTEDARGFDAELIQRDLTFLRIVIDTVHVKEADGLVAKLIHSGGLYGFVLEYQFPSPDSAPKLLKDRIQGSARNYNAHVINFRHKRIFKLNPDRKLWALWQQSSLLLNLYAQLNAMGKFTKKLIGRCEVRLQGLMRVPFSICHDYLFVGTAFTGSAQIRIELGSHVKSLMERLEVLRYSRPGSEASRERKGRARSRQSSNGSPRSRATTLSPSPRAHYSPTCSRASRRESSPGRAPLELSPPLSSPPLPYPAIETYPVPTLPSTYLVHLIVYSARRLPAVVWRKGEIAGSTYVSVIANDGHILCSPTCSTSFKPEFNWSQSFEVSERRQNLVVKLWQKCFTGPDKVLGFVSIPLPPRTSERTEYEMSNLMASPETPLITISLKTMESSSSNETPLLVTSPRSESPPSPVLRISREEISEKLKKNLTELETLLADLKA